MTKHIGKFAKSLRWPEKWPSHNTIWNVPCKSIHPTLLRFGLRGMALAFVPSWLPTVFRNAKQSTTSDLELHIKALLAYLQAYWTQRRCKFWDKFKPDSQLVMNHKKRSRRFLFLYSYDIFFYSCRFSHFHVVYRHWSRSGRYRTTSDTMWRGVGTK